MTCICRDDLFAGDCPTTCLIRWATDREGGERSRWPRVMGSTAALPLPE